MKKIALLFGMIVLVSFTAIKQRSYFDELVNLTGGTWVMKTATGSICEQWKMINHSTLRSRGFRVEGSDTIQQEQVDIVEKNNDVNYISTVKDENEGKPVAFELTGKADGKLIFVNDQHDFPQRIVYQFISKDSLHAWIDGIYKNREIRKDFYYKRIKDQKVK